jgi:hypothetical protein
LTEVIFEPRKQGGGEDPANAAAVNRENLEVRRDMTIVQPAIHGFDLLDSYRSHLGRIPSKIALPSNAPKVEAL